MSFIINPEKQLTAAFITFSLLTLPFQALAQELIPTPPEVIPDIEHVIPLEPAPPAQEEIAASSLPDTPIIEENLSTTTDAPSRLLNTADTLNALSLHITPTGNIPGVSVPCTGTDATMYLGHVSSWPGAPGVVQRSVCEDGVASFAAFNIEELLLRTTGPDWQQYYLPPFYYIVKNTTGLAPGFSWKDFQGPLNLNGGFNGFRAASYYLADTEWPTLAAGPSFYKDADGTWHNHTNGDGTLGDAPPPEEATSTPSSVSSVLFIPGIESSRLYATDNRCAPDTFGCDERTLWEPGLFGSTLDELALADDGTSLNADVYAKEDEIISAVGPLRFTQSFFHDLNIMRDEHRIGEWKAIAYDWRFSADDLARTGHEVDGRIYYQDETSAPYMERVLKELATTSPSGKVTIIGYSNGGLIAKALMRRLEASGKAALVDKVVLVGVPQSGTPQAMGTLLYGTGQGLLFDSCAHGFFGSLFCGFLVNHGQARALAISMPGAYQLLPSAKYIESTSGDSAHPLIRFLGTRMYGAGQALYGDSIGNENDLRDFLQGGDGRGHPAEQFTDEEEILSPSLLGKASSLHASIDPWTPPAGVAVYEIAGWGKDTVAGMELYDGPRALSILGFKKQHRPIFIEDGDGIVPVPSALLIPESDRVKKYWINLRETERVLEKKYGHGNLFENESIGLLLEEILDNTISSTLPNFIGTTQPAPVTESKKLIFILHSPLTIELEDEDGNVTGLNETGRASEEIPQSSYGQFGETKYVIVPEDSSYALSLHGQASGSFSLDIQEQRGNTVTASVSFADIPTTDKTVVTLTARGIGDISDLEIDEDGDGHAEATLAPILDQTVVYTGPSLPEPIPTPLASSEKGHGSSRKKSAEVDSSETPAPQAIASSPIVQAIPRTESLNNAEHIEAAHEPERESVPLAMTSDSPSSVSKEAVPSLAASVALADVPDVTGWFDRILSALWKIISDVLRYFTNLPIN